jgi:hypothetical protein
MNNSIVYFIMCIMLITINNIGYTQEITTESNKSKVNTTAKKYKLDLEIGANRYFLYNKYQLPHRLTSTGQYKYINSEIKYPLDTFMIYVDMNLTVSDYFSVQFACQKNVGPIWGKIEDSDWIRGIKFSHSPILATLYHARETAIITKFLRKGTIAGQGPYNFYAPLPSL